MDRQHRKTPEAVVRRGSDGFIASRRNYSQHSTRVHVPETPVQPTQVNVQEDQHVASRDETMARLRAKSHFEAQYVPQQVAEEHTFDLPQYVPAEHPLSIVKKRGQWTRMLAKGSMLVLSVMIVAGGFLFWRGYNNLHKVFKGDGTVAALSSQQVAPELLKGEGDGRVNILMLGVGGENHPGGDLTDTILVLSVDPVNNKAAMLSVPRDMWVKMPTNYFGAYQKINAAFAGGKYSFLGKTDLSNDNHQAVEAGFASIDESLSEVLGIRIDYNVLVDFQAFRQAVDTVDGVQVDVVERLYDPSMAWENSNNPVLADVGTQTMDGKKALIYARSRETSSDFARGERQRQLLVALKSKVLTLGTLSNPTKIDSLMQAFGENVRTDLSPTAATRLYSIMRNIQDSDIASLSLTEPTQLVTTDRVGSASVVRPTAGFNTYSSIQTYVRSMLQDGYLAREHANTYVVGTSDELRQHTVDTLTNYGYKIVGSSTGSKLPAGATIVDLTDGQKPYTRHYLQDRYGISAVSTLPTGVTVPVGTEFVIIAGI